ncbi:MAG: prealbumin-like fold domain-containing protein, partial [Oscillospiraceae bacterium]
SIWTNDKITGDVSFIKIGENNKFLANAEFTLYQNDAEGNLVAVQKAGNDVTAKSNDKGVVTFNGLRANESYTIKETTAPKGYKLSDVAIEVSVDATGNATINSGVDNVAVPDSEIKNAFRNELIKGSYQFTKVANDGTTTLSGAEFTMTEKQNIMTR